MKVSVTRDSVCAGDDADAPHELVTAVDTKPTVQDLVPAVCRVLKLASISGGRATWVLSSRVPLAVIAQEWPQPRWLSWRGLTLGDLDMREGVAHFHVSYLVQHDPAMVYAVFSHLTLRQP